MSGEASALPFSRASAAQRIAGLLDQTSAGSPAAHGRLLIARGSLEGRRVHVAASDPSSAHGAIGVEESDALAGLLVRARAGREPVLLLLDSAGANVEQGLAALGAFRRLFRALLEARAAGVPLLALLGRHCFGGASMLACACHRRSYLAQTRLATSGPGVIETAAGAAELDASDQAAVTRLMGSAARVTLHPEDGVRNDSIAAARTAAIDWLRQGVTSEDPGVRHARLGQRLRDAAIELPSDAGIEAVGLQSLHALLPRGYEPHVQGNLFCALPAAGSGRAAFVGALGGSPIGAADCWLLADWVLGMSSTHPRSPIVLVLDAQGHAARVRDEQVLLSDYLVHLSLVIAHATGLAHRVVLWIPGAASGASYVAFAAPAERVSALPSARIAVLPSSAVQRILGARAQATSEDWFTTGVADALLDSRLAAYHANPGDAS